MRDICAVLAYFLAFTSDQSQACAFVSHYLISAILLTFTQQCMENKMHHEQLRFKPGLKDNSVLKNLLL